MEPIDVSVHPRTMEKEPLDRSLWAKSGDSASNPLIAHLLKNAEFAASIADSITPYASEWFTQIKSGSLTSHDTRVDISDVIRDIDPAAWSDLVRRLGNDAELTEQELPHRILDTQGDILDALNEQISLQRVALERSETDRMKAEQERIEARADAQEARADAQEARAQTRTGLRIGAMGVIVGILALIPPVVELLT